MTSRIVTRFVPPKGTTLLEVLGESTAFRVAKVLIAGAEGICKRPSLRSLGTPTMDDALRREAWILEHLSHPSLPRLCARGADDHGPYLLESSAPGSAVASDPARAREAFAASFRALAELHLLSSSEGPWEFVHGDLSPEHVFFDPIRGVTFVDLSSAECRDLPRGMARITGGTLPFAAPEVVRGEAATQASDVYAMAATLACSLVPGGVHRSGEPHMLVLLGEKGLAPMLQIDRLALPAHHMQLLQQALETSPSMRPNAVEILSRLEPSRV